MTATIRRPKRLLLQGATGSIGQSVLAVVREQRDRFSLVGLAARSDLEGLLKMAAEFRVESVALTDSARASELREAARERGIRDVYIGGEALTEQVTNAEFDLLVNALSGGAGLEPSVAAIERGISVALANKEALVAAGPLLMNLARAHGARILPIDSEHSALFQCLIGEDATSIRRLWLTTSGGPFWGYARSQLQRITAEEALRHPTWRMGPKISVDSATLFNKGLEVIEAQRLFDVESDQIAVVAHRQSIIHSLVEFTDGSIKAQLSVPDMRLPILFALSYPERVSSDLVRTAIPELPPLTFEPLLRGTFPCFDLALDALRKGGTAPAALAAADEIAVKSFLDSELPFTKIDAVMADVLSEWTVEPLCDLEQVKKVDHRARQMAAESVRRHVREDKG